MNQVCKGSYVFGRILGEPSRRLHLLIGATLKGKQSVDHTAEGDRGKGKPAAPTSTLKLGQGLSYIRIKLQGWRRGWGLGGRRWVA